MIAGMCITALACAMIFVPVISELIDAVKEKEGIVLDNPILNDKASGIFNTAYAIGCMTGPVIGGLIND